MVTYLVDSSYPPGVDAWKGSAVRRLKGYVSWVNTLKVLKLKV